jgi:arylsulfatase A-like enzyme
MHVETRARWTIGLAGIMGCVELAAPGGAPGDGVAEGPVAAPALAEQVGVTGAASAPDGPRRVLLVIADDMSAAATPMYASDNPDVTLDTPPMPTVQGICGDGVRFRRAWSMPTCAPTRAAIHTGRFNFRNETVELIGNENDAVSLDEPAMPRLLDEWAPGTNTALFGKWNLGSTDEVGGDAAPNTFGWDHYAGHLGAALTSYYDWPYTVDGVTVDATTYVTTQTVDDTISWLAEQPTDQPWVVWLAFTAPHAPFHAPPDDLHSYDLDGDVPTPTGTQDEMAAEARPYYNAAAEAMDTELGRLLAWADANGQGGIDVIFVADNGIPPEVTQAPMDTLRAKGTTYEGGVHVPMCVSGPSVARGGRVDDSPVSVVDLLATVLDLAGAPVDQALANGEFDSQSLAPVLRDPTATLDRDWVYSEGGGNLNRYGATRAILHDGDKLIQFLDDDDEELYNLWNDAFEENELLHPEGAGGVSTYSDGGEEHGHGHAADRAEELAALLGSVVGD